ncbi:hypothetical protein [Streptomyces sp. NPDC050560]
MENSSHPRRRRRRIAGISLTFRVDDVSLTDSGGGTDVGTTTGGTTAGQA